MRRSDSAIGQGQPEGATKNTYVSARPAALIQRTSWYIQVHLPSLLFPPVSRFYRILCIPSQFPKLQGHVLRVIGSMVHNPFPFASRSDVDVGQPSLRSSPLVIFLSGPPTTSKSNASERSTKLWYPYSPGCLLGSSLVGTGNNDQGDVDA